jgi:hypothetical protein
MGKSPPSGLDQFISCEAQGHVVASHIGDLLGHHVAIGGEEVPVSLTCETHRLIRAKDCLQVTPGAAQRHPLPEAFDPEDVGVWLEPEDLEPRRR